MSRNLNNNNSTAALQAELLVRNSQGGRALVGNMRVPTAIEGGRKGISRGHGDDAIVRHIESGSYFHSRAKRMTSDAQGAIAITDKVVENFGEALTKFLELEKRFAAESKRVSGNVRDSAEKLSQGLARIEKAADLDRLSRVVELLERAATALNSLAELERLGKLEKISAAIR